MCDVWFFLLHVIGNKREEVSYFCHVSNSLLIWSTIRAVMYVLLWISVCSSNSGNPWSDAKDLKAELVRDTLGHR